MGAAYSSVTEYSFDNVTTTDLVYNVAADDTLVVLVVAAKFYANPVGRHLDYVQLTGEWSGGEELAPFATSDIVWSAATTYNYIGNGGLQLYNSDFFTGAYMPAASTNKNYVCLGAYSRYYAAATAGETATLTSFYSLAFEGAAQIIQITGTPRIQRLTRVSTKTQDRMCPGRGSLTGAILEYGAVYSGSSDSGAEEDTTVVWQPYVPTTWSASLRRKYRIVRRPDQLKIAAAAYYDQTLALVGDPTGYTAIADTPSRASANGLVLQTWYKVAGTPDSLSATFDPVPSVAVTNRHFTTAWWATWGQDTTGGTLLGHVA